METTFEIRVERVGVDISKIYNEITSSKVAHLWKNYGNSFYAFRKTETIRVFGPKDVTGIKETVDTMLHCTDVQELHREFFPYTVEWLITNTAQLQRASFIKLYSLETVTPHKDEGKYFDNVKRYHLAVKGRYKYTVGNSSLTVVPGTLFTFNNQLLHGTQNMDNEDRITLVFDVLKPL